MSVLKYVYHLLGSQRIVIACEDVAEPWRPFAKLSAGDSRVSVLAVCVCVCVCVPWCSGHLMRCFSKLVRGASTGQWWGGNKARGTDESIFQQNEGERWGLRLAARCAVFIRGKALYTCKEKSLVYIYIYIYIDFIHLSDCEGILTHPNPLVSMGDASQFQPQPYHFPCFIYKHLISVGLSVDIKHKSPFSPLVEEEQHIVLLEFYFLYLWFYFI